MTERAVHESRAGIDQPCALNGRRLDQIERPAYELGREIGALLRSLAAQFALEAVAGDGDGRRRRRERHDLIDMAGITDHLVIVGIHEMLLLVWRATVP